MNKTIFLAIVFALFTKSVLALPESSLMSDLKSTIPTFIHENIKSGEFIGGGNLKINYLAYKVKNPIGVIAMSPGQAEAALKYIEFIYDMKDAGYDIFVIDHRGQGTSDRMLKDSVKSHVVNFSDYVDDFTQFVYNVVRPRSYAKSVIVAHSMGGAIASAFLVRDPKAFSAVVLSAPMIEVNTKGLGYTAASIVAGGLGLIGYDDEYAPGQKAFNAADPFVENTLTSSEPRFNMFRDMRVEQPVLAVGGTTVHWVKTTLKFTSKLRKRNNVYQVPTLLLQAEKDTWVKPGGQNEICKVSSPKFCKIYLVKDSKHEILMERDSIRDNVLAMIRNFIARIN